jgi:hypothetical protein
VVAPALSPKAKPTAASPAATKAEAPVGAFDGYGPLVAETIELFAFIKAADESKRRGGKPVMLADGLAKAQAARP